MPNKDYLTKIKKNKFESKVQEYYIKKGYLFLSRGWPDFIFYKLWNYKKGGIPQGIDIQFVEVKRNNQTTIKPAQKRMKKLFKLLGLDYKVCFGVNDDGSPNFKDI